MKTSTKSIRNIMQERIKMAIEVLVPAGLLARAIAPDGLFNEIFGIKQAEKESLDTDR
jgi:hypothetical protein